MSRTVGWYAGPGQQLAGISSTKCVQLLTVRLFSFQGPRAPPFHLSLHPFAMLTAPKAAEYARKQSKPFTSIGLEKFK